MTIAEVAVYMNENLICLKAAMLLAAVFLGFMTWESKINRKA